MFGSVEIPREGDREIDTQEHFNFLCQKQYFQEIPVETSDFPELSTLPFFIAMISLWKFTFLSRRESGGTDIDKKRPEKNKEGDKQYTFPERKRNMQRGSKAKSGINIKKARIYSSSTSWISGFLL